MLPADPTVGIPPVQIVAGVNLRGDDLKEVGTGSLGNVPSHPFGVAGGGVVNHQNLAGFRLRFRFRFSRGGRCAFGRFRRRLLRRRSGFRLRGGRSGLIGGVAGGKAEDEQKAQENRSYLFHVLYPFLGYLHSQRMAYSSSWVSFLQQPAVSTVESAIARRSVSAGMPISEKRVGRPISLMKSASA